MSWQQFKSIGEKLHADLVSGAATGAKLKPSHVRAALKVLDGKRIAEELGVPAPGAVGKSFVEGDAPVVALQILKLLAPHDDRKSRQILALVDSMLTAAAMGKRAEGEITKLYGELRREFEPGALRMIIEAATRADRRAEIAKVTAKRLGEEVE